MPRVLTDRNDLAAVAFDQTRMPMIVTDPRLPEVSGLVVTGDPGRLHMLAQPALTDQQGRGGEELAGQQYRVEPDHQDPDTNEREAAATVAQECGA